MLIETFHCSLLSPVGDQRLRYTNRSQGKRAKKRKRDGVHEESNTEQEVDLVYHQPYAVDTSPDLELLDYLTVGFNSTNRHLEALATPRHFMATPGITCAVNEARTAHSNGLQTSPTTKSLVAVFVSRSDQPSIMHSHLPMLIQAASLAPTSSQDIKLVILPKGAEKRLSAALGIPRVGIVGLMDGAPAASPLMDFVRKHVPKVEIPWLAEAEAGGYLPVKINIIHTTAPMVSKQANKTRALTTKQ